MPVEGRLGRAGWWARLGCSNTTGGATHCTGRKGHIQSNSTPGSSMATLCELTRWVTNKASRVNLSSETILVPLYLSMGWDQLYQEVMMDQQKAKE